jgi:hypothetical protein
MNQVWVQHELACYTCLATGLFRKEQKNDLSVPQYLSGFEGKKIQLDRVELEERHHELLDILP